MARYTRDLVLNKPMDFVAYMMNDYLQKNGFSMSEWKGEPAYRAGDAMLEGYKYMKWYYDGYTLHVEAWMKGSFGGEMDLDGFVGALQKKPFKESLEQLFILLMQQIPAAQPGMMMQPGMQGQVVPVIPVQTVDNPTAAILALVLGIFSIVLGFIIPLFGLICAVLGVNQARLGGGSSKAGVAKAGKVLSIIGLVVSAIMWLLNIVITIFL